MRFLPIGLLLALLALVVPLAPVAAEPETETGTEADAERELVLKFVDELRQEAAEIRGLEWKETIPADLLSRDQLEENLIKMIEQEISPEELERDTRIMRRLGLLRPDEDPLEMMLEAMREMIGGYYNPEEKKLYLIAGMTGEAQKPVILHELVHALEDQYYGLRGRVERFEDDPDQLFAEKCIEEGSAEYARERYQEAHPDVAKLYEAAQQDPAMMQKQIRILQKIPAFLIVSTLLHYQLGPAFVNRAVADSSGIAEEIDFPVAIHALYENPPVSQEQLLHPERWFGPMQDFPQKVVWGGDFAAAAGEGWEKVHDMTSGQLDLASYVDFFLGTTNGRMNLMLAATGQYFVPRAKRAAEGWDAGRTFFMQKEGLPAAWIQVYAFDTQEDAVEAYEALAECLQKAGGDSFVEKEETLTESDEEDVQTLDYETEHGTGRMQRRGTAIILVDGVPEDVFSNVWKVAAATTFEKDERDSWDPAQVEDPYAEFDWSDKDQGIGLRLPGEEWKAESASGMPGMVAKVDAPDITILVMVAPLPPQQMRQMIEPQLGGAQPQDAEVAGAKGFRYDVMGRRIYLGGTSGKTVVLRVEGAGVEANGEAIDKFAKDIYLAE